MLFQLLLMADDTRLGLGWKGTLVVGRGSCSAIPQVADRWLCADRLKWMRVPSPRIPPLAPGEPLAGGRGWCPNKSGGNGREPWGPGESKEELESDQVILGETPRGTCRGETRD